MHGYLHQDFEARRERSPSFPERAKRNPHTAPGKLNIYGSLDAAPCVAMMEPMMNFPNPKIGAQESIEQASPVIFLGPTLPIERAQAILKARYLPPIRRGNLDIIRTPVRIGIIDGVLDDGIRIESNEISAASERGLRIYGAGSTGALLAATDRKKVVQGIGSVYRFLASYPHLRTLIEILYTEPDHETLTLPLINVVLSLEKHYPHKSLNIAEQLRLIPLPERSGVSVRTVLANCGIRDPEKIMAFNYKSDDATRLLKWLGLLEELDAWYRRTPNSME